mmetsp:Transcript_31044/g.54507  ORF Transcript_31044/g.54507 Transcript_31044/m.54507 type:complete len:222 (-) Transcript_31044:922-1587(-)
MRSSIFATTRKVAWHWHWHWHLDWHLDWHFHRPCMLYQAPSLRYSSTSLVQKQAIAAAILTSVHATFPANAIITEYATIPPRGFGFGAVYAFLLIFLLQRTEELLKSSSAIIAATPLTLLTLLTLTLLTLIHPHPRAVAILLEKRQEFSRILVENGQSNRVVRSEIHRFYRLPLLFGVQRPHDAVGSREDVPSDELVGHACAPHAQPHAMGAMDCELSCVA